MDKKQGKRIQIQPDLLQKLEKVPDSCIEKKLCQHHLMLHPFHLGNVGESVIELLNAGISKYHKKFDGILLGYEELKVFGYQSPMSDDTCYMHTDIEANFYLFKPVLGVILNGIVNKKSQDHIGCLVHTIFNVSIPKPEDAENWTGFKAQIGQEIKFRVTSTKLAGRLPYIQAELISLVSEDSGISTSEESSAPKKKHKKRKKCLEDQVEVGAATTMKTETNSPKKKKKNKKKDIKEEPEVVQEEEVQEPVKKKKSKKDKKEKTHKKKEDIELEAEELKETPEEKVKEKKKKKEKKEKGKDKEKTKIKSDPDELLGDLNLNALFDDVKPPIKSNDWHNLELPPDSELEELLKEDTKKSKSKKRKREDDDESDFPSVSQPPKKKKSKRKHSQSQSELD